MCARQGVKNVAAKSLQQSNCGISFFKKKKFHRTVKRDMSSSFARPDTFNVDFAVGGTAIRMSHVTETRPLLMTFVAFRLFSQVAQAEMIHTARLDIVVVHQCVAISLTASPAEGVAAKGQVQAARSSVGFAASACLHGATGKGRSESIGWNTIHVVALITTAHHATAVGVFAREVEKVYTGESDEESAQKGNGVDRVGRVETLEKDERCDERKRRESDIVEGVDAMGRCVSGN